MSTKIRTASGIMFDLLDPRPDLVRVEDLAHALAGLNRFTGHVRYHYSVAEHSCAVARRVAELGGPVRQALLHDAAEAYVGDVSSPLKQAMRAIGGRAYDILERRVWVRAICPAFGLDERLHPLVKQADSELADTEGMALIDGWVARNGGVLGREYVPRCWGPRRAAEEWLSALFESAPNSCRAVPPY